MPGYSPIQKSFRAGEVSRRVTGQTDSLLYQNGLELCENFIPTPQGSLLMRQGAQVMHDLPGVARLVPFRVSGSGSDYVIVLTDLLMQVYDRETWTLQEFPSPGADVITNGQFTANADGWTLLNAQWNAGEYVHLGVADVFSPSNITQDGLVVEAGKNYKLRLRAWDETRSIQVQIQDAGGTNLYDHTFVPTSTDPTTFEDDIVGDAAMVKIIISTTAVLGAYGHFNIDDIELVDQDTPLVTSLVTPWSEAQLPGIQYDSEPAKSRTVLVHGNVFPQIASRSSSGAWRIEDAPFTSPPTSWSGTNFPSIVEVGFQGRLWLGATPSDPHTVWMSKSGNPFDFTPGTDADSSTSFIVSTKGAMKWLRGQKRLFAGGETIEHAISGGSTVIAPGNIQVEDESAFGSGAVQGQHIGDQVIWATRSRRSVRAMSYNFQEDAWLSVSVNQYADHIIPATGIIELHFAREPFQIVFVVCQDGSLRACTYDRPSKTVAWFRVNLGFSVISAAVAEGEYGAELWMAVEGRKGAGTYTLERIPLHETSAIYFDGWVTATKTSASLLTGADLYAGESVWVAMDGVVLGKYDVDGAGEVASDAEFTGTVFAVGTSVNATAKTLPLEGGNPQGTSQGLAVHWSEIVVRLNDSARPRLNGERASLGKAFGPSMDALEDLISKDVRVASLNIEEGGQVTITQDVPYRTEVCGLFGQVEVTRV